MKFTAAELVAFAESAQYRKWRTKTGRPFSYEVRGSGIYLLPESTKERNISNSEIARFCDLYSERNSELTSDYKELFNKSYLLAIAAKFEPDLAESPLPEEVSISALLLEGATKTIEVNSYERSAAAKRKCIEVHGTDCSVCGFDFGKKYGDFATGFIHVHHLKPLAAHEGEHIVDPVTDLRPVCPNCHAVIHLRGGCLSIEEARELIRGAI